MAHMGHAPSSRVIASPVGPLTASATADGLCGLFFDSETPAPASIGNPSGVPHLDSIERELAQYFAGELREFRTPLAPVGTEFQQRVWDELLRIPFGETRSYAQLAVAVGDAGAFRAVARANATNPIAIVVPCHRVIGSDGTLTGYGGGLERKAWLLGHEKKAIGVGGQVGLFEAAR